MLIHTKTLIDSAMSAMSRESPCNRNGKTHDASHCTTRTDDAVTDLPHVGIAIAACAQREPGHDISTSSGTHPLLRHQPLHEAVKPAILRLGRPSVAGLGLSLRPGRLRPIVAGCLQCWPSSALDYDCCYRVDPVVLWRREQASVTWRPTLGAGVREGGRGSRLPIRASCSAPCCLLSECVPAASTGLMTTLTLGTAEKRASIAFVCIEGESAVEALQLASMAAESSLGTTA